MTSDQDALDKVQLNGRYPRPLAAEARSYAIANGLSLNSVMSCALAEYLAKRRSREQGPAPQLHYERGRPSRESTRLQAELLHRDPRGRKLQRAIAVRSRFDERSHEHEQNESSDWWEREAA